MSGGLGNQLFQLAAALHLQSKTNLSISFFTEHLKDYETPREFMLQEILPKEFLLQFSKPNGLVQIILKYRLNKALPFLFKWSVNAKNILSIKPSKFFVLDDYFQDISIFKNELKIVAGYINQAANSNKKVDNFYKRNNQFNNEVAFHIRRGDFLSKTNSSVFYIQENEYYKKAISTFENVNKIYVFSESSIEDLATITSLNVEMIESNVLSDTEQFLLMSKFSNLVIANSTYSFWAAIASLNCKVVAPKNWFYNEDQNGIWLKNLQALEFKTL